VESLDGWRIKVYGIAYGRPEPRPELVDAGRAVARERLPRPAVTETRYGVGFLGIHDGRGANFVFVDWWERENELHHHVYFSSPDKPAELRPPADGDPVACTWDLSVVARERDAWVRHVLASVNGPDLDAYLADQHSGQV
jgi:prepilin-type processing-associated H-X9-DG protein